MRSDPHPNLRSRLVCSNNQCQKLREPAPTTRQMKKKYQSQNRQFAPLLCFNLGPVRPRTAWVIYFYTFPSAETIRIKISDDPRSSPMTRTTLGQTLARPWGPAGATGSMNKAEKSDAKTCRNYVQSLSSHVARLGVPTLKILKLTRLRFLRRRKSEL